MNVHDAMRLRFEAEEFLYREAALFDQHRYSEWLEMVADDIEYWAPAIESVEYRRESTNRPADADGMAFFKETKATLRMRVERLVVGGAWAESPPSRMCHYVSNVRVASIENDELLVNSNFSVFRSRIETEEDTYFGSRVDRLRRVDGQLMLARRKILLTQAVLKSRNITTFF